MPLPFRSFDYYLTSRNVNVVNQSSGHIPYSIVKAHLFRAAVAEYKAAREGKEVPNVVFTKGWLPQNWAYLSQCDGNDVLEGMEYYYAYENVDLGFQVILRGPQQIRRFLEDEEYEHTEMEHLLKSLSSGKAVFLDYSYEGLGREGDVVFAHNVSMVFPAVGPKGSRRKAYVLDSSGPVEGTETMAVEFAMGLLQEAQTRAVVYALDRDLQTECYGKAVRILRQMGLHWTDHQLPDAFCSTYFFDALLVLPVLACGEIRSDRQLTRLLENGRFKNRFQTRLPNPLDRANILTQTFRNVGNAIRNRKRVLNRTILKELVHSVS